MRAGPWPESWERPRQLPGLLDPALEARGGGGHSWDTDEKPLRGRGVCLQISSVRL